MVKLSGMWGGFVNENLLVGIGLLRIICYYKLGRGFVVNCFGVVEVLCNIVRFLDDW